MKTEDEPEKRLLIEIFYKGEGLQYEGFSYEADERLEIRDITFLLACMTRSLIEEDE